MKTQMFVQRLYETPFFFKKSQAALDFNYCFPICSCVIIKWHSVCLTCEWLEHYLLICLTVYLNTGDRPNWLCLFYASFHLHPQTQFLKTEADLTKLNSIWSSYFMVTSLLWAKELRRHLRHKAENLPHFSVCYVRTSTET